MSTRLYRMIMGGKNTVLLSAVHTIQGFSDWTRISLDKSVKFDLEQQVAALKLEGYNVYVVYQAGKIHLVSAIPPDSLVAHPQWILTCSDYLAQRDPA
jgi:hypothetical protein